MAVGPHEPEASRLMLRVAPQRFFHNPKRQRGIALLTIRDKDMCSRTGAFITRSVSEGSHKQVVG